MTHTRYGRSLLNLNGQLTNTRRSDGAPEPDGSIKVVARKKILGFDFGESFGREDFHND
jgi:hypothetical protein